MTLAWRFLDSWWTVSLAVAGSHLALANAPIQTAPREFVDLTTVEMFKFPDQPETTEPEPEPEPPPPPPPDDRPDPGKPRADDAPPISNRPPDPEAIASAEPVPYVTGLPLDPSSLLPGGTGMGVRVGNTFEPGYDANLDPSMIRGFVGSKDPPPRYERPKLIRSFQPPYPEEMLSSGIEGGVRFEVLVGMDGRAKEIRLIEGVHPVLDSLGERSLASFRWRPARQGNHPAEEWVRVTFKFQIDRHAPPVEQARSDG